MNVIIHEITSSIDPLSLDWTLPYPKNSNTDYLLSFLTYVAR